MNGSLSHEDLQRMGGDRRDDTGAATPRDSAKARARARTESAALLGTLRIACDIGDAQLVVSGTRRPASGGKEEATHVYEVACTNAMGYLLESQGDAAPLAISCLAAEETRSTDAAKGKEPGFFCKLPDNRDVYAKLTTMIAADTGTQCTVATLQAFGRSQSTQSDYSEVACKDGKGFLIRLALPGSSTKAAAMSCADAAKQGIKCRLTDAGTADLPVTMENFKTALAQNGVACKIEQLRLIGQEDHLKRYVVEYLCANQPIGAIAFLPLEGNANPYESLECAAAVSRNLVCTLMSAK